MSSRNFDNLSKTPLECGGEMGYNHSKRLIKLVDAIAGDMSYNKEMGGYPKYARENTDHAARSREIIEPFMEGFSFSEDEKEIIYETILNHHNPVPLKSIEAVLLRDADAIDFLGFMGIARDITRAPGNIKKGIQSIQSHRKKLPGILTLDSSKKLAEERIKETDLFLDRFQMESYSCF
jgi:uncharacterized protein